MRRTTTLLALSMIVLVACAPPSRRSVATGPADGPRTTDVPPAPDADSVSERPTPADTGTAPDTDQTSDVPVGPAADARLVADARDAADAAAGPDAPGASGDAAAPSRCTGGASCSAGDTCLGWCDPGGAGWFGARRCNCSGGKLSCGACALVGDAGVPAELALPACKPGTAPGVACMNEPVCLRQGDAGVRGCQCFGSPSRWRCSP